MYCKNCGAEIYEGDAVCPECGMEITAQNEEPREDSQRTRREKLDEIKQRRDLKRKKEQKRRVIAIAVLVAAIVAIAGGVLAWLNSNFGERVTVDDPKNTAVPIYEPSETPVPSPTPEETQIPSESPAATQTVTETPVPSEIAATASPAAAAENAAKATAAPKASAKPTAAAAKKPKTSSPVTVGAAIQNKYVMLDNVYVSKTTGAYIMSFKMGGTTYYANVNKGTSKSQISGKYYYITAHPTDAVYNGMPVYEITSMTKKSQTAASATKAPASVNYSTSENPSDYVLPNSSSAYITDAELARLTESQLSIAKNEIYARHGRKFKNSELQKYFESKSWYSVNPNYNYTNDSANLTQLEKTNLLKILNYKK